MAWLHYFSLINLIFCVCASGQSLRQTVASRPFRIGTAVDVSRLGDLTYRNLIRNEFNQVQPENELKWMVLRPSAATYTFTKFDSLVDFATANGMSLRGHVLIGESGYPSWLTTGNFSQAQLREILRQHISTVVGRYSGRIYAWDVVNEAFDGAGQLKATQWLSHPGIGGAGTQYIETAFRMAHEADPNALLFYNDTNAETLNAQSDAIYRMALDFKQRGVPIHGIGLQMHLDLNGIDIRSLEQNIARFAALGLQVQITELDVRLPVPVGAAPTLSQLSLQADIYAIVAQSCLRSPACTAVQTWGVTDRYSWIPDFFPGTSAALPFDSNYAAKPAYYSLRRALEPSAQLLMRGALRDNASFAVAPISAGQILVLFVNTQATGSSASTPISGFYPTRWQGVEVHFDGIPAPILAVHRDCVVMAAPYGIESKASVPAVVRVNGQASNVVEVEIRAASPGLFTAAGNGTGTVLAHSSDGRLIDRSNPARAGDLVTLYGTGIGRLPGSSAAAVASSPAPQAQFPVSATILGSSAEVQWAGALSGAIVGTSKIVIRVPASLPGGEHPLQLRIGSVSSQAGVTLPVR